MSGTVKAKSTLDTNQIRQKLEVLCGERGNKDQAAIRMIHLKRLQEFIATLTKKAEELQVQLGLINQEIIEVKGDVFDIQNEITLIHGDIADINEAIDLANQHLSNLEQDINALDDVVISLTSLPTEVADLKSKLNTLTSQVGSLSDGLVTLGNTVSTLSTDMQQAKQNIQTLRTDVNALQQTNQQAGGQAVDLSRLQYSMTAVEGSIQQLQIQSINQSQDIAAIEQDVSDNQTDIALLQNNQADHGADIQQLIFDMTQSQIDINDLDTRLSLLEDVVENLIQLESGYIVKIGIFKIAIIDAVTNSDGLFTVDYSAANFSILLFALPFAYADTNYTTTDSSNFASPHKEQETLTSLSGRVKGAESLGLVGTVLVSKSNARVKVIVMGV